VQARSSPGLLNTRRTALQFTGRFSSRDAWAAMRRVPYVGLCGAIPSIASRTSGSGVTFLGLGTWYHALLDTPHI